MINSLAVNKKSNSPSPGFDRSWNAYALQSEYNRHFMTEENREGIIAHEQSLCFQFDRWGELLQEYDLRIPAGFNGF